MRKGLTMAMLTMPRVRAMAMRSNDRLLRMALCSLLTAHLQREAGELREDRRLVHVRHLLTVGAAVQAQRVLHVQ